MEIVFTTYSQFARVNFKVVLINKMKTIKIVLPEMCPLKMLIPKDISSLRRKIKNQMLYFPNHDSARRSERRSLSSYH